MYVPTGDDLREARTARGLTQGELADRADVSQPLLSRIENEDVDPRLPTLHRIAQAINDAEQHLEAAELEVAVPEALKDARTATGLTQAELAERADVSQPLIARIENDNVNPRASTLRAILAEVETGTDTHSEESDTSSTAGVSAEEFESDILAEIERSFDQLRE
ncbi:helix-turn-helix domain-containing protein [Halorientalis marina]|uniref:helix-turn-helix domain-containing protein n=1 Tax=Halorientalis marina TaxID=2931976 RepID=UPI001FF57E2E|nr:helix-turn-helix domain-containing protein [Halorientalis marina]